MERDPIDKVEFWKERIEDAKTAGLLHRSVYKVHPNGWEIISGVHKKVCDNLIFKDSNVLDAGCGYGRLAPWFQHYTGVDFSPEFIALAQESYPNKPFFQADFRELPFEDEEFDWAICVSIREMYIGRKGMDEWLKIEKELKRVAKKVLILEYVEPEKYTII